METETTGTIYNIQTIAKHSGLSVKYLQNPESPLKRVIQTFPDISPDGKSLNDIGLIVFDEYLRCCSNKDDNGVKKPLMSYEEWKQFMANEYGMKSAEKSPNTAMTKANSVEIAEVEVLSPTSIFEQYKSGFYEVGDRLADELETSLDEAIGNKLKNVIARKTAELQTLLSGIK